MFIILPLIIPEYPKPSHPFYFASELFEKYKISGGCFVSFKTQLTLKYTFCHAKMLQKHLSDTSRDPSRAEEFFSTSVLPGKTNNARLEMVIDQLVSIKNIIIRVYQFHYGLDVTIYQILF